MAYLHSSCVEPDSTRQGSREDAWLYGLWMLPPSGHKALPKLKEHDGCKECIRPLQMQHSSNRLCLLPFTAQSAEFILWLG